MYVVFKTKGIVHRVRVLIRKNVAAFNHKDYICTIHYPTHTFLYSKIHDTFNSGTIVRYVEWWKRYHNIKIIFSVAIMMCLHERNLNATRMHYSAWRAGLNVLIGKGKRA